MGNFERINVFPNQQRAASSGKSEEGKIMKSERCPGGCGLNFYGPGDPRPRGYFSGFFRCELFSATKGKSVWSFKAFVIPLETKRTKVLNLRGETTTDGTELHHQEEQLNRCFCNLWNLLCTTLLGGPPPTASMVTAPFIHLHIHPVLGPLPPHHPFSTRKYCATTDKVTCGPHYHHHLWSLNTNTLQLANLN